MTVTKTRSTSGIGGPPPADAEERSKGWTEVGQATNAASTFAGSSRPPGLFRATASALLVGAMTFTPGAQAQSRGELLYSTHCIACHSSQMHWRDKKVATDAASLKLQVQRWQSTAGLGWSESDIEDVTRYLNETIYRYAPMANPLTLMVPANRESPLAVGPRLP